MRPSAGNLVPLLALSVLVAVAASWSASLRSAPLAAVYDRTHALAKALQAGDVEAVLALGRPPASSAERADRIAAIEGQVDVLRGRAFRVTALQPEPGGGFGARIQWFRDRRGLGAFELELRWVRDAGGAWRLP